MTPRNAMDSVPKRHKPPFLAEAEFNYNGKDSDEEGDTSDAPTLEEFREHGHPPTPSEFKRLARYDARLLSDSGLTLELIEINGNKSGHYTGETDFWFKAKPQWGRIRSQDTLSRDIPGPMDAVKILTRNNKRLYHATVEEVDFSTTSVDSNGNVVVRRSRVATGRIRVAIDSEVQIDEDALTLTIDPAPFTRGDKGVTRAKKEKPTPALTRFHFAQPTANFCPKRSIAAMLPKKERFSPM